MGLFSTLQRFKIGRLQYDAPVNVAATDRSSHVGVVSLVRGRFHHGDTLRVRRVTCRNGVEYLEVMMTPGSRAGTVEVINGSFAVGDMIVIE